MLYAILIELLLLSVLCSIHYRMATQKGHNANVFIGMSIVLTFSVQLAGGALGAFLYENEAGMYGLAFLGACVGAIMSRWVILFLPEKKEVVVSESLEVLDR